MSNCAGKVSMRFNLTYQLRQVPTVPVLKSRHEVDQVIVASTGNAAILIASDNKAPIHQLIGFTTKAGQSPDSYNIFPRPSPTHPQPIKIVRQFNSSISARPLIPKPI
ncbi:hypothetical protein RUND412_008259, partial [Rhizina undulata]